jgi:hypothetical protein
MFPSRFTAQPIEDSCAPSKPKLTIQAHSAETLALEKSRGARVGYVDLCNESGAAKALCFIKQHFRRARAARAGSYDDLMKLLRRRLEGHEARHAAGARVHGANRA